MNCAGVHCSITCTGGAAHDNQQGRRLKQRTNMATFQRLTQQNGGQANGQAQQADHIHVQTSIWARQNSRCRVNNRPGKKRVVMGILLL